jgi:hypothetical protein
MFQSAEIRSRGKEGYEVMITVAGRGILDANTVAPKCAGGFTP